jgi:hypothetical protein
MLIMVSKTIVQYVFFLTFLNFLCFILVHPFFNRLIPPTKFRRALNLA